MRSLLPLLPPRAWALWLVFGLCALLTRPASLAAAPPDADLAARIARVMPTAATVSVELADGLPAPLSHLAPPTCPTRQPGLCDVHWPSAPDAFAPLPLPVEWAEALRTGQAKRLLRTEDGQPLVVVRPGRVLLALDLRAVEHTQPGARLRRWAYFNYLLHTAICESLSVAALPFAQAPGTPLLRPRTLLLSGLALVAIWLAALLLYQRARAQGRARPDAAQAVLAALDAPPPRNSPSDGESPAPPPQHSLPFARPLSGLLTLLSNMLLLIGPYYAMQSVLARRVQPLPDADGLWRGLGEALFIVWLTFDLGTQTAFVKYFAQHRSTDARRALADVQFYIWFQVFSRLIEMTLLFALVLGYLPRSSYALYTPLLLLYAATCQPAFPAVGKFLCQAAQRFDYYNLLDFLESRILSFLVPIPFVLLGRWWGLGHADYGEAYGAAFGMGIGGAVCSLLVLAMGLYALSRLGVPLRALFLAQFDRGTARRQLVFGLKLTIGQEPFRLTSFVESLLIMRWLRDYPTWLGIRDILHNRLTFLCYFAWGFYQSAVPVLSEAFSVGKKQLVQYLVARYLQLGSLFAACVFSLLLAVGPTYIDGALGGEWMRAKGFLWLAAIPGLFLPWAWLTDVFQQGAGRPGLTTVVMLCEQALRLALIFFFVPRFQFVGIYLASITALGGKCLLSWTLNHRLILPLRVDLWRTLGVPLLLGLCNFAIWRGVALGFAALGLSGQVASIALFFVAGTGSVASGLFLFGLCGGIDPILREELTQAAALSTVLPRVVRWLTDLALWGARLCPVTPRPPLGSDA